MSVTPIRKSKTPAKKEARGTAPPAPAAEFYPLARLRDEMERLFDDFYSSFSHFPFRRHGFELEPFGRFESIFGRAMPAVDVVEGDKAYVITAELPGLDQNDIEVELADDVLTISGEKEGEAEEKKEGYYLAERRYGAFRRSFRVPESIDKDKIDARFDKGLLSITLPKTKAARKEAKKIAVKSA